MTVGPDPVLQAVLDAAVNGTGGSDGWLLAVRGEVLEVVAAAGPSAGSVMAKTVPGGSGTAGFVVGSGQPIALTMRPDDPRAGTGVAALMGRPPDTVLCVPCQSDDGVTGALEIVDKAGGAAFSFDDVELATLLAGIAGVCLDAGKGTKVAAPAPGDLAGELERLAANDPGRYAAVAGVLEALITSG